MKLQDLLGQGCIVRRVDSAGDGKPARVDRVNPDYPFPIHVSWGAGEDGGAWFMPFELVPSRVML